MTAFSIVVPTIGREKPMRRLLESLTEQTFTDFEVVVVADVDVPLTFLSIFDFFRKRLDIQVISAPRGLSLARNVGIKHAIGNRFAFTEDDCWYFPDTLEKAWHLFRADIAEVINGKIIDDHGRDSQNVFLTHPAPINKQNVWNAHNGGALFATNAAVKKLRGFDEGMGPGTPYGCAEDADFVLRADAAGLRTLFVPELKVGHPQVIGKRYSAVELARSRNYAPGFGHLLRKHYGMGYLGYRLARSTASAVVSLVRGDIWKARYKLAWAKGTLTGFVATP